ncbi:RNA polymerase sigma factor [Candidatus Thioglobus sp.]|nr:RNA polymerase sigma factor [Candidatus Thioglobus sp.]
MSIFNNNLKTIYPDIMRVAKGMTKNDVHNAEDLVQKTLLKALEKQQLFKGGNLTGWVVRIMQNIFRDEYRKNKTTIELQGEEGRILEKTKWGKLRKKDRVESVHVYDRIPQDGDISKHAHDTFDDLNVNDEYNFLNEFETRSELIGITEALNKLGNKCKEILLLISEEYKYKEISERLDVPMGTVMNRLLRCRKKLHQELYGLSEYNEI